MKNLSLALALAAALAGAAAAPARADNATTYDRCSSADLRVAYASASRDGVVHVPVVGRTGLLPIAAIPANAIDPFSGPTTISWVCGNPGSAEYTRCGLQTVAFEIVRSGDPKFRIDCYDAAGLDALKSPH